MAVERELRSDAAHVGADLIHASLVSEGCGEIAEVREIIEEHADAEVAGKVLGCDDGTGVVPLDDRESGSGKGRYSRRVVQVVPRGAAQVTLVVARERVQPAG